MYAVMYIHLFKKASLVGPYPLLKKNTACFGVCLYVCLFYLSIFYYGKVQHIQKKKEIEKCNESPMCLSARFNNNSWPILFRQYPASTPLPSPRPPIIFWNNLQPYLVFDISIAVSTLVPHWTKIPVFFLFQKVSALRQ